MLRHKLSTLILVIFCATQLQGCFTLAVGGVAATALAIGDRRSTGIYIEDEALEWKTISRINEKYKEVHVNATSYNLTLLLTGEVPSDTVKGEITEIVRNIPNVRGVHNEIVVRGNSSLASRGSDTLITSNVKARIVTNGKVSSNHIKVVTENASVFLLGMVTQSEGENAAEVARTTSGASKVVKLFEYIPNDPADAQQK